MDGLYGLSIDDLLVIQMSMTVLMMVQSRLQRKQERKRRTWIRPIFQRRRQQGAYHHLVQELRLQDTAGHSSFFRMSKRTFDGLLLKVTPFITRRRYTSLLRAEISPAERLALTLRFLATGESQISLSFSFRIGRSTVNFILRETCCVLWDTLSKDYVKAPSSAEDWQKISRDFYLRWNFPNCVGAIDGKHIVTQAPKNSGSLHFNYKGTFSIVLMAACDANYRFILVDLGAAGRQSDGGIFSNSAFGTAFENGSLVLPTPTPLPGTSSPAVPFVMVGDEAFPLRNYLMRPFPGRNLSEADMIFNYRLSRARRVIENTFGILAARWRIFRRRIIAKPENVEVFAKAAIALHNMLRSCESTVYCPSGFVDGEDGGGNIVSGSWREESSSGMLPVSSTSSNRYSRSAAENRHVFRDYLNSPEGEVSWQYAHIRRTQ